VRSARGAARGAIDIIVNVSRKSGDNCLTPGDFFYR